ncbi:MAG: YdbL family protein [Erythrobacter sp.]
MTRNILRLPLAAFAVAAVVAVPVFAQQRDPAYAAARASGAIGEQPDGYLGIVGAADPALQRLVDDINIKRRAVYADGAQKNNATLEAYAFAAGCTAIKRTAPGEKYRTPDGAWATRGAGAPMLHSNCPQG